MDEVHKLIYAMSDIHGCMDAFEVALGAIDLADDRTRLVLLGDYCDRGPASLQVFRKIMELQECYPGRVIALRGNHEEMLLEYVDAVPSDMDMVRGWMLADSNLATAQSFLTSAAFDQVKRLLARRQFEDAYQCVVAHMKDEHGDVLAWIRRLPYFYETEYGQVFVHAGIDEDAGDIWKLGTPDEFFTCMPPHYAGSRFHLDVIAGHVSTASVSGIPGYQGIWYDGASHYYIDGDVMQNGRISVLCFDEGTRRYSGEGLDR